jgi:hypothetical protein
MKLSITLQFKIEKNIGGQPVVNFASDAWVTININPANFIFLAKRISWWQAFQAGSDYPSTCTQNVLQYTCRMVVLSQTSYSFSL